MVLRTHQSQRTMRLHSSTNAIYCSSFSVRKKRQKLIQGLASPWKSRGRKPFGARMIYFHRCSSYLSQERHAVRSDILHQAKTICKSGISCGCYSVSLHFHRRDAGKLSSSPTSVCRRFWFSSLSIFISLENCIWNLHKKVHGSGWNPADPPQTRCNLWFNEKYQRNKSKLSWKINSAIVKLHLEPPLCL